jgi:hypothetical protein
MRPWIIDAIDSPDIAVAVDLDEAGGAMSGKADRIRAAPLLLGVPHWSARPKRDVKKRKPLPKD